MIRLIGYFFGIGTALALLVAAGVGVFVGNLAKDLPDYEVLAKYEPPVTTRIHAVDGSLMGEFARERRLYLPIQAVPDRVKAAFLSAEDKNFYHHPGVDVMGLFRAAVNNLQTGSRQESTHAFYRACGFASDDKFAFVARAPRAPIDKARTP